MGGITTRKGKRIDTFGEFAFSLDGTISPRVARGVSMHDVKTTAVIFSLFGSYLDVLKDILRIQAVELQIDLDSLDDFQNVGPRLG